MSAHGHVCVGHPRFNNFERGCGAFVDDLDILFGKGDVDFIELYVELSLLFNLWFSNVKVLALEVRATDQAVVIANCYTLLNCSG